MLLPPGGDEDLGRLQQPLPQPLEVLKVLIHLAYSGSANPVGELSCRLLDGFGRLNVHLTPLNLLFDLLM